MLTNTPPAPQVNPQQPLLSMDDFANKIKAQYPAYANVDNATLAQKMIAKYPVYASRVNMNPTPSTDTSQSSFLNDAFNQIGQAAQGGVNKIKEGLQQTQSPSMNPIEPLEAGTKIAAGAIDVATSPFAPLFSPAGKLIGYISNKISDNPAVQKFAQSPAGAVTERVAQDVGNLSEIAGAAAGMEGAAPVKGALETGESAVADKAGNFAAQTLGASTGTGAASVKEAFNGGQAFLDALRGKVDPESLVQSAQDIVGNIAQKQSDDYQNALSQVKATEGSLDISPVLDTLDKQLQRFGISVGDDGKLNFDRSTISDGADSSKVQQAYDIVQSWGSQQGDRTAAGIDILKRKLDNLFNARTDGKPVSAFLTPLRQSARSVLSDVPGYDEMTANYQKTANLLDEIKSATGIGGTSKPDTVFTKLTTALKGDKDFRLEVMKEMQSQGSNPDLMAQLAGTNMNSFIPKGLFGKFADLGVLLHFFAPQYIPTMLATSPRIVGEFVNALGYTKPTASLIMSAFNDAAARGVMGSIGAATSANLQPNIQQTPAPPTQ